MNETSKYISKEQRLKWTVIGDKVAHLKPQKIDISMDFHTEFHHYSTTGF